MAYLALNFLGGFEVTIDAEPITAFGADKARALLAFLAVESSLPHRRDKLSAMFWPDLPAKRAAHNLSQTLLRLRKALQEKKNALSPTFLLVAAQGIQFNMYSDYHLDVLRFRELLNLCHQHNHSDPASCGVCAQWLSQAAELYRGDLLTGFFVPDSVPFEEWRLIRQEELHQQAMETLNRLAAYHDQRGEYDRVQAYARRQIALEPWREEAHMQLMRAGALSGQTAVALKQYEQYRQTLADELGIMPAADVTALYEQIRSGKMVQPSVPQSGGGETVWLSSQGERRQVTTLACSLGVEDEPEDIQDRLIFCEQQCEGVFHRFGGRRLPRRGNVCLVYFGYPQAYEDAAHRAVYAGLTLSDVLENNKSVRIGIHTGVAVVGKKRGPRWQDRDLVGAAIEIAQGCQRLAGPGEVVITKNTQRLVQGSFDLQPLGSQIAGGSGQPMQVYQVCGEGNLQNRLDWLAQTQRLTALTGREEEMSRLRTCRDRVLQGQGQAVFLCGEPGIGKSRLIWELETSMPTTGISPGGRTGSRPSVLWLSSRCLPHYQNTSLYPMVGLLEQLVGFQPEDSVEVRREKLVGMLAGYKLDHETAVWLFSLLLGLPTGDPVPETITKAQREQMRLLFMALLQKRAAEQLLVVVIEDLQWSDPSTVEWLGQSFAALAAVPCLTLLTARTDFNPTWLSRDDLQPNMLQLSLKPLRPEQARQMVADLVGESTLDEAVYHDIVSKTDGVPLFVEELTKALLEHAVYRDKANKPAKIPITLLDLLAARLDHLGAAKETAQWAAVLGREFSYQILQACTSYDEQRLQSDLVKLIEAELVSPIDRKPNVKASGRYTFKHALMQETAYASLLKRTRQLYHLHIAEVLETRFPKIAETRPEILAEHFTNAGISVRAADFWLRAGERAAAHGATLEARTCFDRALEGIEPADNERRWQALLGREQVLDARGERAEQEADLRTLLTLAEAFDDDARRFQVYMRQTSYAAVKGDYHAALPLAETAVTAARQTGNVVFTLRALAYKTQALLFVGEMNQARQCVEEILACVENLENNSVPALALTVAAQYYMETGDLARAAKFQSLSAEAVRLTGNYIQEAAIRGNLGLIYAMLGLYTQARTTLEAGEERAKEIGDRRLYASIMCHLGYVHDRSGDKVLARKVGEQALKALAGLGDAYGEANSLTYLGHLLEEAGELTLAAKYLAQARASYAGLGLEADKFEAQALEARVALALGQHETAEQLTTEVWHYLSEHGSEGFSWPSLVYVCVADVLAVSPILNISLHEVIEAGYRDLMERAEKISDADWRRSFLESVAENKSILEQWEKMWQEDSLRV
ncbi:MAG: AAA family ATPase [Anaerolineales bacterium]|nr:AAA family ATPase [Anaerolineales bacterium]